MIRILLILILFPWPALAANWTMTNYYQFPDKATADAIFQQLGGALNPDGSLPTGDQNYTLVCGIQEGNRKPGTDGPNDAGDIFLGYWCMGKMNRDWTGYAAATAALSQYLHTQDVVGTSAAPRTPWNVYQ